MDSASNPVYRYDGYTIALANTPEMEAYNKASGYSMNDYFNPLATHYSDRSTDHVLALTVYTRVYADILGEAQREHPTASPQMIQREAIDEFAEIIEKALQDTDFNYGLDGTLDSLFLNLTLPRLGEQVQDQLHTMTANKRPRTKPNKIDRFVGYAADNPHQDDWHYLKVAMEDIAEYGADAARGYLARNAPEGIYRQLADSDDTAILQQFHALRRQKEVQYHASQSVAAKACELAEQFNAASHGLLPRGLRTIDWLDDASFRLISDAHAMLHRGVSPQTVEAYALAKHHFPDEPLTPEFLEACRDITAAKLGNARGLPDTIAGKELTTAQRLCLAKLETYSEDSRLQIASKLGYDAASLVKYPWLLNLDYGDDESSILEADWPQDDTDRPVTFPAYGNRYEQQKWLTENAYTQLYGGWNKASIGKIIMTRLENGIEMSVHDASQWLSEFQIPTDGYDVKSIKRQLQNGELPDVEPQALSDHSKEQDLIRAILSAPQHLRDRLLLPKNPQRIADMFSQSNHALLYASLIDIYKDTDLSYESLVAAAIQKAPEFYNDYFSADAPETTLYARSAGNASAAAFTRNFRAWIESHAMSPAIHAQHPLSLPKDASPSLLVKELSDIGQRRKAYVHDATSWLSRHMTTPHQLLTKVWQDRPQALAAGVSDNARAIEVWQKQHALELYLNNPAFIPGNLTKDEVLTTYKPWVEELSRVYSSDGILRGISKFKEYQNNEALLPPASLKVGEQDALYTAEILAKDDPRGMTIGSDTGCCMNIDGASANCIVSGYRDKEAGFFALYTPEGRIAAQSYFYVNSDHPDVLVLDNIEANEGRDTEKIIGLYRDALQQYMLEQFTKNDTWRIRTIQVGTGYGDAVRSHVLQLPHTSAIPNNLPPTPTVVHSWGGDEDNEMEEYDGDYGDEELQPIYTDAHDQRLLLKLTDQQIQKARDKTGVAINGSEKVTPNHTKEISLQPLDSTHAEVLVELEQRIYPKSMHLFDDKATLREEMSGQSVRDFSFVVSADGDGARDYIGYCLAYLTDSTSDIMRETPVLYVADLAVAPDAQGQNVGAQMLAALLQKADQKGIDRIEFEARESTSYAALTSSSQTTQLLARYGYKLTNTRQVGHQLGGENFFRIIIEAM